MPDVKTGETPEPGIFETGEFDFDTLKTRFREMAFLNKGIRITLTDERDGAGASRVVFTTRAASFPLWNT